MFKFLKDKLKKAVSKFSSDVDEEAGDVEQVPEEQIEKQVPEQAEERKEKPEPKEVELEEEPEEEPKPEDELPEEDKSDEPHEEKQSEEPETTEELEVKSNPEEPEVPAEEPKKGFFRRMFSKKEETKAEAEVSEEEKSEEKSDEEVPGETSEVSEQEVKAALEKTEELEKELGEEAPLEALEPKEDTHPEPPTEEVEEKPEAEKETSEKEPEPKKDSKEKIAKPGEQAIKEEVPEEKKGIFSFIKDSVTKKAISEDKFEELFWDLEIVLLENNVAVEVIEKIKSDLKEQLVDQKVLRGKISNIITETLENSLEDLFVEADDIYSKIKSKKPYVIMFLGVNGSGKTTNLAKFAKHLTDKGHSVVIAACDTFRAAAIQQIEEHANKLDIKLIKHDYGSDAAAVAFDAIKHAEAKGKDVVLIDTAGRSHSNTNLMDELKKVVRVSSPDYKIFVGDSLTGNDVVEQAKSFDSSVGIDGIILSKVDVDEKGGAAVSVSYVTRKPILFIGTGQTYADLKKFDKKVVLDNLGFQ